MPTDPPSPPATTQESGADGLLVGEDGDASPAGERPAPEEDDDGCPLCGETRPHEHNFDTVFTDVPPSQAEDKEAGGRTAYEAYDDARGGYDHAGNTAANWEDLTAHQRRPWEAVAHALTALPTPQAEDSLTENPREVHVRIKDLPKRRPHVIVDDSDDSEAEDEKTGNEDAGEWLGKRIRVLREAKDTTLTDLAKQAGITKSFLCDIELKGRLPTVFRAAAIADALGVTLANLIDPATALPSSQAGDWAQKEAREMCRCMKCRRGDPCTWRPMFGRFVARLQAAHQRGVMAGRRTMRDEALQSVGQLNQRPHE